MKALRIILMAVTFLSAVIELDMTAFAFHNGGVGPCEGCHTMHNSSAGAPVGKELPSGRANSYLLIQRDSSSTCLNCHQRTGDTGPSSYHISTPNSELFTAMPPKQLSPAGDFGWLRKTYSWMPGPGLPMATSPGERHGHNIVASDFLYTSDTSYAYAPGGTYPAAGLGCTSCHDPHGKYRRNADGSITTSGKPIAGSGSLSSSPAPDNSSAVGVYRMLGGKGYQPKSLAGNYAFVNDPPDAVAPDVYNRTESSTQTRVAYGAGMSEWCRNCHPNMHTTTFPGTASLLHAAGNAAKLGSAKASTYNTYIRTGDLSGTPELSYLSLVPYEEGTKDYGVLKAHARSDNSFLTGPDAIAAEATCLSCHRAHASGWDGMTRWNTKTDYIAHNGLYAQETEAYQPYGQGRTETEATRAYYDFPAARFAGSQDTLCNKCHGGVYP